LAIDSRLHHHEQTIMAKKKPAATKPTKPTSVKKKAKAAAKPVTKPKPQPQPRAKPQPPAKPKPPSPVAKPQVKSVTKPKPSKRSLREVVDALPEWLKKNIHLERISTMEELRQSIDHFKARIQQGFDTAYRVIAEENGAK
jgi:hypothetical protein